jgi:hypothetical protein
MGYVWRERETHTHTEAREKERKERERERKDSARETCNRTEIPERAQAAKA